MKQGYTEIAVVMDRSGSMASTAEDAMGGFNNFVEQQRALPGEANLTLVLFDNKYEVVHENVNIQHVPLLTANVYYPRGSTALLDAMGRTIQNLGARLAMMAEADRPEQVIVVIITDGMENSSVEFTNNAIREMVKHQQEKYNWQFMFFGANMDAFTVAGNYGIDPNFTLNYEATTQGTRQVYTTMSNMVTYLRTNPHTTETTNKIHAS